MLRFLNLNFATIQAAVFVILHSAFLPHGLSSLFIFLQVSSFTLESQLVPCVIFQLSHFSWLHNLLVLFCRPHFHLVYLAFPFIFVSIFLQFMPRYLSLSLTSLLKQFSFLFPLLLFFYSHTYS